jgi:hypothetical protein
MSLILSNLKNNLWIFIANGKLPLENYSIVIGGGN